MTRSNKVLLVTDIKVDADDIVHLLKPTNIQVIVATDNASAVQAFEKHCPKLLLCARKSTRDNEHLYLDLYRNCKQIHTISHHAILLCSINDTNRAHELCRRGIFSDYVVDKPRHDVFRLRLSIEQFLLRFENTEQQRELAREFSCAGDKAKYLNDSVENVRVKGQSIAADSATKLQLLSDNVMQEMAMILSRLNTYQIPGLLEKLDPKKIQQMILLAGQEVNAIISQFNKALDATCSGHKEALGKLLGTIKQIPATIVVIDDNKAFTETIGDILSEYGYRVLLCNEARHGIGLVAQQHPDLILMDIYMPGMDGLAATSLLKTDSRLKNIPIIMLSGKSNREVVMQVKKIGANGFITKPINTQLVLDKVAQTLQKNRGSS
jgi:CheY-like chemotaxis protein